MTKFSVFPKGYISQATGKPAPATKPSSVWTIKDAYLYIMSDDARNATLSLRKITDERQNKKLADNDTEQKEREYKTLNFITCTFGGHFSYRSSKNLIASSNLMVIDIDDLESEEEARRIQNILIEDKRLCTCLCFVSPRGCGVKWVIEIPQEWQDMKFKDIFMNVYRYVAFEYGIETDRSGSDICRACYLPWDENCYINDKFLKTF